MTQDQHLVIRLRAGGSDAIAIHLRHARTVQPQTRQWTASTDRAGYAGDATTGHMQAMSAIDRTAEGDILNSCVKRRVGSQLNCTTVALCTRGDDGATVQGGVAHHTQITVADQGSIQGDSRAS